MVTKQYRKYLNIAAYLSFAGQICFIISILICSGDFSLEDNQVKCSISLWGYYECQKDFMIVNCYSFKFCKLRRDIVVYSILALVIGILWQLLIFIEILLKLKFNQKARLIKKLRFYLFFLIMLTLLQETNYFKYEEDIQYSQIPYSFQIAGLALDLTCFLILIYLYYLEQKIKKERKKQLTLN